MNSKDREKKKREIRYTDARRIAQEGDKSRRPTWRLPPGFEKFELKVGKQIVDVIPYVVGDGNPKAESGMIHYERRYWIHDKVGANEDRVVCLQATYGEPCPVCEEHARQKRRGADWKSISYLRPKMRQLFNLCDREDPDKKIRVHEQSHFKGLGQMVDDELKLANEDDPISEFFKLENGMSVRLTSKEETFNGRPFVQLLKIDFVPRKDDLSEDLLDEACCLDDCIVKTPYDEVKRLFEQTIGVADEEEDEDEDDEDDSDLEDREDGEPLKSPSKVKDDEDDEPSERASTPSKNGFKVGDWVMYNKEKCTIMKIDSDKGTMTLEDPDNDPVRNVPFEKVSKIAVKGKDSEGSSESDDEDDD